MMFLILTPRSTNLKLAGRNCSISLLDERKILMKTTNCLKGSSRVPRIWWRCWMNLKGAWKMRKLSVLILVILGLNLKSIRFVCLLVISYFFPSSELVLRNDCCCNSCISRDKNKRSDKNPKLSSCQNSLRVYSLKCEHIDFFILLRI